jgi:hypothetical protein
LAPASSADESAKSPTKDDVTKSAAGDKAAHAVQQKASTPTKPSGKVAPEPAKGAVKGPETKTTKPKSPDLGF